MGDALSRLCLRAAWMYVGAVALKAFQHADAGDAWRTLLSCCYVGVMVGLALRMERRLREPRP